MTAFTGFTALKMCGWFASSDDAVMAVVAAALYLVMINPVNQ